MPAPDRGAHLLAILVNQHVVRGVLPEPAFAVQRSRLAGAVGPHVRRMQENEPAGLAGLHRNLNGRVVDYHWPADVEGNAPGHALAVVGELEPVAQRLGVAALPPEFRKGRVALESQRREQ